MSTFSGYRNATLTRRQWKDALAALDRLREQHGIYRTMLMVDNELTNKDKTALFLLRGQMLLATRED